VGRPQSSTSCATVRASRTSHRILPRMVIPAEAAQIVLDAPVKTVMVPLNVTHTAIVTDEILVWLRSGTTAGAESSTQAATNLRHTLSTLIGFFAEAYRTTFGFKNGPPLHDALAVAYVSRPGSFQAVVVLCILTAVTDLFTSRRFRVDVELSGTHTSGETVVDMWGYRQTDDSWGPHGKNCIVTETLDVSSILLNASHCLMSAIPGPWFLRSDAAMYPPVRPSISTKPVMWCYILHIVACQVRHFTFPL
jgi:inosine-uridine nucleoside N-ribohydrolase